MESKAVSELKFVKLLRQEGSSSLTLGTSTQDVVFEIPASCVNLSESMLKFDVTSGTPAANNGTCFFRDVMAISRVRLETRQGAILADINHAPMYQKASCRAETMHDSFMTNADDGGDLLAPMFRKPEETIAVTYDGTSQPLLSAVITQNQTTPFAVTALNLPAISLESKLNNLNGAYQNNDLMPTYNREAQVLRCSDDTNVGTNSVSFCAKLGEAYPNSVFSLDKSIPIPEVLVLRLTFADRDQWGFEAPAADIKINDYSNAVVFNPAANNGDLAVANIALYAATEQNMALKTMLMSQASSEEGLNVPIGYIHSYKSSLGAGSVNQSLRFSSGHGQTLTKIYHTISTSEEKSGRYDSKSTNKITSFRTLLNDMNRQEYELTVANNEDYEYLKEYLRGSVISRVSTYKATWSWIESFVGNNKEVSNSGSLAGLPLGNREQKWSIYLTMASAHPHFSFACCQKLLRLSNAGVQVL